MMRQVWRFAAAAVAGLAASGAAAQPQPLDESLALERMRSGESYLQGAELERALRAAAAHPLGSRQNPVRAAMPAGQRAYLARLRCADGLPPEFQRSGNLGAGIYGNIIDAFDVICAGSRPPQSTIVMDMYHSGHVEERAVPGFTIAPAAGAMHQSVTPEPAPDDETPSDISSQGQVRIVCSRGRGSIMVGQRRVGPAPGDCGNGVVVEGRVSASRSFPSGEQVFLLMGPGGHMTNAGAAVYVRPGQPPRVVQIDYAVEAGEILAPDRFTMVATGVQNIECRAATWVTEYRVDWSRSRILSSRDVSRDDGCDGG